MYTGHSHYVNQYGDSLKLKTEQQYALVIPHIDTYIDVCVHIHLHILTHIYIYTCIHTHTYVPKVTEIRISKRSLHFNVHFGFMTRYRNNLNAHQQMSG